VNDPERSHRLFWIAAAAALLVLAWQGHRLSHLLPGFEKVIEELGPWGPIAFIVAILVLEPLLVPDTLFAITAGVVFGPVAGSLYYGVAVYAACLLTQWLGARWLKEPVLRRLATQERIRMLVEKAAAGGTRSTLLVRLVPVNQAILSYALGAAGVPLRSALVGNFAMFTHMLPPLWFGAAAVHMTRMAGTGHAHWERDGVIALVGLALAAVITLGLARRTRSVGIRPLAAPP
jgi:uncharacterized membrane protein YdjX (TVP38/TMEM64 family)